MNIVTIIPARGGSKRLPRKALYPVLGIPMIKRVFDEAKQSKHINKIVVSTEDKEIKELCIENNVEVQDRPEELSEGENPVIVGIIPSITRFLLTPRDPEEPGDCNVRVASLVALSLMVPLFAEREFVAL